MMQRGAATSMGLLRQCVRAQGASPTALVMNNSIASSSRSSCGGGSSKRFQQSRGLASTPRSSSEEKKGGGIVKSILYGSEKAKAEAPLMPGDEGAHAGRDAATGQHSHIVGRGKYIHEIAKHVVKPDRTEEYKALVAEYYDQLAKDPNFHIKLTGSWEVVVGEIDTYYHIWEHDGFAGMDAIMPQLAKSEQYKAFQSKINPLLNKRESQLVQEFSFWPSSPPKQLGGIYEMRIYDLKPGSLLEWEHEWRIGLDARRKFVQPIGAWFAQVGKLHQVIHMWHYDSLDARKQKRQKAWEIDTWSNTVAKTVKLTNAMSAQILRPLPFSPLR